MSISITVGLIWIMDSCWDVFFFFKEEGRLWTTQIWLVNVPFKHVINARVLPRASLKQERFCHKKLLRRCEVMVSMHLEEYGNIVTNTTWWNEIGTGYLRSDLKHKLPSLQASFVFCSYSLIVWWSSRRWIILSVFLLPAPLLFYFSLLVWAMTCWEAGRAAHQCIWEKIRSCIGSGDSLPG